MGNLKIWDATNGTWKYISIDGTDSVAGPVSSADSSLAAFNGTTGQLLKDTGVSIDIDGTLAANSDLKLATQKAIKTYADTKFFIKSGLAGGQTAIGGTASSDSLVLKSNTASWLSGNTGRVNIQNSSLSFTGQSSLANAAFVNLISFTGTVALTGVTIGGFSGLQYAPAFQQDTSLTFGTMAGVTSQPTYQPTVGGINDSPNAVLSNYYSSSQHRLAHSGGAGTTGLLAGYLDAPVFIRTSGTGTHTITDYAAFSSFQPVFGGSVGDGYTVTNLRTLWAKNVVVVGGGTVVNNIGLDVNLLTAGTNNIGIRNASTTINTPDTAQSITAATQAITILSTTKQITSTGNYTMTSTPTIANGQDGQVVTIINVGSNIVTLQDQATLASSNLQLSTSTVALAPKDNIQLMYSSTIGGWVQISKNYVNVTAKTITATSGVSNFGKDGSNNSINATGNITAPTFTGDITGVHMGTVLQASSTLTVSRDLTVADLGTILVYNGTSDITINLPSATLIIAIFNGVTQIRQLNTGKVFVTVSGAYTYSGPPSTLAVGQILALQAPVVLSGVIIGTLYGSGVDGSMSMTKLTTTGGVSNFGKDGSNNSIGTTGNVSVGGNLAVTGGTTLAGTTITGDVNNAGKTITTTYVNAANNVTAVNGNLTMTNFFGAPYITLRDAGNTNPQVVISSSTGTSGLGGGPTQPIISFSDGTAGTGFIGDAYLQRVGAAQLGINNTAGTLQANISPAINAQTGTTYTLVLTDAGKQLTLSNASPITLTLPSNSVAIPVGTIIPAINVGVGTVTFAAGGGATIQGATSVAQYNRAYMTKTGTNTWTITSAASSSSKSVNAQTGTTYTFILGDKDAIVTASNGSAQTYTIPLNSSVAYPVGTQLTLAQIGTGAVTAIGSAGVTVNGVSAGSILSAQYQTIILYKTATDTWQAGIQAPTGGSAPRVNTITAVSNVYTIDPSTTDLAIISSPAANFTVTTTGSPLPKDGQSLQLRIVNGATGYIPTWNSVFASSGLVTLPSTAYPNSKTNLHGFTFDATAVKWVLIALDAVGY